jgi:hypothetical protein
MEQGAMSLVKGYWLILAAGAALAVAVPHRLLSDTATTVHATPDPVVTRFQVRPVPALGLAFATALFTRDRTPIATGADAAPPAPDAQQAAAPPPAPMPTLVGLAMRARGRAVALVKLADGSTVTAGPGDTVDGWRVAAIGRDRVTFAQGGETRAATLDFNNKPGGGAAASPVPPPPTMPPPPAPAMPPQLSSPPANPLSPNPTPRLRP